MKSSKIYATVLLCLLTCLSGLSAQLRNLPPEMMEGVKDKPTTLSYRFADGHHYSFHDSLQSTLNFLGLEIKIDQAFFGKTTVLSQQKDVYEIRGVLQRVMLKSVIPDSSAIEIDTDSVSEKDLREAGLIKEMTKKKFVYQMSNRGRASNFNANIEKLYEEIHEQIPGKFQETLKDELPRHMRVFLHIFPPYPKKAKLSDMKRGYYWVVPIEYPFGPLGTLRNQNVYYYLGVTSYNDIPCAKIAVQSKAIQFDTNPVSIAKALPMLRKLGFSESREMGEELPLQLKFDKGTFQGEIYADLQTGEVVFQKFSGELILMVTIFGGEPTESRVDFSMTTTREEDKTASSDDDEDVKKPKKPRSEDEEE
jgi:hypothetical protein